MRGEAGAPLLVVYADFTCPHCALAARPPARRAASGVAFRHFALRARHPRALALARASEAAARQGAFWAMHDALYADQGRIDDPHLWARVRARWGSTSSASRPTGATRTVAERVARDVRDALRAGAAHDADALSTASRADGRRAIAAA